MEPTKPDNSVINTRSCYHTGKLTWKQLQDHPFLFLQEHKQDYKSYAATAIRGKFEPTLLNHLYYSKANMDIIQYRLKKFVFWETWKQTKIHYIIEPQDESTLLIIMKYVFETYGKNLPYKIKEQIEELDNIVIKEAGPETVSQVLGQAGYLNHINNPITPIDRPVNVSHTGTKILPSVTTIFA